MSDVEQGIPMDDKIPVATVRQPRKRYISLVWLIPVLALLTGGWLVYKTLSEKGPTITITFKSAKGLETDKTRIKYKEVDLGKVTRIELSEDLSRVIVTAELAKNAKTFLSENTRFWVVRARVAAKGVSGLGTLFSGAYITLDPGKPGAYIEAFRGIEEPPAVTAGTPGRIFYLKALRRGSIDTGSPILYRQIEAGQVVNYSLSEDGRIVTLKVFINAPYHRFVYKNSRFWNASGIDVKLDSQGVRIDTDSMVSLLIGGISFGIPQGTKPSLPAEENAEFILYDTLDKARETAYLAKQRWLIYFDETVRGLSPGAPVEMQGIRVGQVLDFHLEYDSENKHFRIPVLVELEPERVFSDGSNLSEENRRQLIENMVNLGYRAQLETGNLLTGQLIITLTRLPDAAPATINWQASYPVFPAVPKTIQQIKVKVARIIDRMDKMPLEQIGKDLQATVSGARRLVDSPEIASALKNLDATLLEAQLMIADLRATVTPQLNATLEETRLAMEKARQAVENAGETLKTDSPLQVRMKSALDEVARAARSMRQLMDFLERHPESIISGKGNER